MDVTLPLHVQVDEVLQHHRRKRRSFRRFGLFGAKVSLDVSCIQQILAHCLAGHPSGHQFTRFSIRIALSSALSLHENHRIPPLHNLGVLSSYQSSISSLVEHNREVHLIKL